MVEHVELSSPNAGSNPQNPAGTTSKMYAKGTETPQLLAQEVPPLKKKRKLFLFMKRNWTTCLSSTDMSDLCNGE